MSENLLRYWREDPLLNDHHWHWHHVYPYEGKPERARYSAGELIQFAKTKTKPGFLEWNSRHGELFAYMHSQLLARYAAERLSVGLPPQSPLSNYRDPIPEGCSSGVSVTLDGRIFDAGDRPDYTTLTDLTPPNKFAGRPGASIASQELYRDRLSSVAASVSAANRPSSISEFAERIEATDRSATPYFGALHNDGHLLISMHDNADTRPGVMFWEETALRDPVFYRWHSHIDQMFRQYEDSLGPQDIRDLPPVDQIQLAIVSASDQLNVVTTEMRTRAILRGTSHEQSVEYLSHEDFWYLIHVHNKGHSEINTTVRIFMAPEISVDDRRAWIEMDKFHCRIEPGSPTIIERSSTSSAVVRHPVQTTTLLEGVEPPQNELGISAECRCGWPYPLLLPRGTFEGLDVRFMVLFTSGDDLKKSIHDPNSASYCGLQDNEYPDKRPMGFPFDRPLTAPIREWMEGALQPAQLAHVQVKIVHRG